MSLITGVHTSDYLGYNMPSGSNIETSLQIAWEMAENFIGTTLQPEAVTDEQYLWPSSGKIKLKRTKLNSITTITARHDDENCTCGTTDYTGCSIISNPDHSIILVRDCNLNVCSTCTGGSGHYPVWALVDYVAGYAIGDLNEQDKFAISLLASLFVEQMNGTLEWGAPGILSWRSMSYSERRTTPVESQFGDNHRASMAFRLLRHLRIKSALKSKGL